MMRRIVEPSEPEGGEPGAPIEQRRQNTSRRRGAVSERIGFVVHAFREIGGANPLRQPRDIGCGAVLAAISACKVA